MWVGRKQPKAKGHHLMNGSRKTKNTLYLIIFHSYLILNIGHSPQDIPNLDDRYLKVFPKYLYIILKKGFNFFDYLDVSILFLYIASLEWQINDI